MEAASGSTEVSDRSRSASALLAKITADRSPSDPKVNEFFRKELWSKSPGSFDNVLDKAAELLAPSGSAPHPKPSGVNAPEPVTPKRAPRPAPEMTPSPQRRKKAVAKPVPQKAQAKAAKSVVKAPTKAPTKALKAVAKTIVKTPLRASPTSTLKKLHASALLQFPVEMFEKASPGSRPRRCRVPPLQSWRNERLVYERVAGSLTPSVAAVTLDMSVDKTTARTLEIPALQPPLDFDAVELVGITSEYLISKVYALPLSSSKQSPCTVTLEGTGIIYVLDGALRFGVEGAKNSKTEVVRAGGTMLVKGAGRKLVAPAYAAQRGEPGSAGVRFRWVQCTRS